MAVTLSSPTLSNACFFAKIVWRGLVAGYIEQASVSGTANFRGGGFACHMFWHYFMPRRAVEGAGLDASFLGTFGFDILSCKPS